MKDLPEVEMRPGFEPLEEEVELACRVGLAAAGYLHQVAIETMPVEDLDRALNSLRAGDLTARLWDSLGTARHGMEAFSILQLVDSLAGDIDYQQIRYGFTSLMEDHKELVETMRRLGVYV